MGYLPYRIEPASRKGDGVNPEAIKEAMVKAGAVEVEPGKLLLAFLTLEDAQGAYERLSAKCPGVWVLVKEERVSSE